jgi:hypothetical protein
MRWIPVTLLFFVVGCVDIGSPRARQTDESDNKISGPKITYNQDPKEREADKEEREKDRKARAEHKAEILASTNATRNQLSGLLTTSISKLGEKVTGVEANLKELLKVEANLSAEARVDIRAAVKMMAEFKIELKNTMSVNTKLQNDMDSLVKLITDLQIKIGKIDTNIQTQAQGQVGWNNKLQSKMEKWEQTLHGQAGRDVNMFPKQAVDVLENSWRTFSIIIGSIIALAGFILSLHFKFQKDKAQKQFEAGERQRDRIFDLLHRALVHIPPEKAAEIERSIGGGS